MRKESTNLLRPEARHQARCRILHPVAQAKGQRQPDAIIIANRATDNVSAVAPIKRAVNHFEAHLGISLASPREVHLDSLRRQPHRDTKLVPAFGCESTPLQGGLAQSMSSQKGCSGINSTKLEEEADEGARRNRNRRIRLLDPHLQLQKRAG